MVPMASEAAISRACIQRKLVGVPSATSPADQERGSFQIATANLGQITQVHTPTAVRNSDQPRDSTMTCEYASRPGDAFQVHRPVAGVGPTGRVCVPQLTTPGRSTMRGR